MIFLDFSIKRTQVKNSLLCAIFLNSKCCFWSVECGVGCGQLDSGFGCVVGYDVGLSRGLCDRVPRVRFRRILLGSGYALHRCMHVYCTHIYG